MNLKAKHTFFFVIFLYKKRIGMYHIPYLHFTVKIHKSNIQWNHQKKYEGPTNKFKKDSLIFLEFFDITKRLVWPNIKTKENKIKRIDRKVCFAKHTLDPKQIRPARPEARAQPGLNCFWFFLWLDQAQLYGLG